MKLTLIISSQQERKEWSERVEAVKVNRIEEEWLLLQKEAREKMCTPRTIINELVGFCWTNWNLEGILEIKDFPELETLIINSQEIISLEVSKTPKLEKLTCAYNQKLKSINLTCPNLTTLQIDNNPSLQSFFTPSNLFKLVDIYWEKIGGNRKIIDKIVQLEKRAKERQKLIKERESEDLEKTRNEAIANLEKGLQQLQITVQNLQTELEREKNKNKFLSEQLEEVLRRNRQELEAKIEVIEKQNQ